MAGISHASALGAGAGVAGATFGARFLLRAVGSSVLDVGDSCSDGGGAEAEAEAESVSGIGQFHFGGRPKFSSTSPVNHSPSTVDNRRRYHGRLFHPTPPANKLLFFLF
jgi:hypothetical protein